MRSEIVDKIINFKKATKTLETRITAAAKLAVECSKISLGQYAEIDEETELKIREKYTKKIDKLNEQYTIISNLQKDIIKLLSTEEKDPIQQQLLKIFLATPDYAGLDQSAEHTLKTGLLDEQDLQSILFMHDILIEHIKLVSRKAIKLIKAISQ